MPLPDSIRRTPTHTRAIECRGYQRADGLWDVDAHLTDIKHFEIPLRERGRLAPGTFLHDMWLRLTVDRDLVIRDAIAVTDAAPYRSCAEVNPWYTKLIGLRIASGWDRDVRERLGGVNGCTHLTELLRPMATAVVQTVAFFGAQPGSGTPAPPVTEHALNPALVDSCHSYNRRGATLRTHFPALAEPD